jgi:hypothetical protein
MFSVRQLITNKSHNQWSIQIARETHTPDYYIRDIGGTQNRAEDELCLIRQILQGTWKQLNGATCWLALVAIIERGLWCKMFNFLTRCS